MGRRSRGKPVSRAMTFNVFVGIAPGLEKALRDELLDFGFRPTATAGGVEIKADLEQLYFLHCWSRLAARITIEVARFRSTSPSHLADQLRRIDVSPFIWPNQPIDVRVTTKGSRLRHRESVAKKAKLALQDAARRPRIVQRRGRPIEARVQLRIVDDLVTVAIDASGELLHRRGWRKATARAPIRENLGAAVLFLSGWSPGDVLVDPMCGSGTFGIEAAQIMRGMAPGANREFGFEHWPCHEPKLWQRIQRDAHTHPEASQEARTVAMSDRDSSAVKFANENARRAGVAADVTVTQCDFDSLEPPEKPGYLIANPPYGERLKVPLGQLYRHMGAVLRERWSGWNVTLLVPDLRYQSAFGFSLVEKAHFSNGGITVYVVSGRVP